jgi:hypothetical protein
MPKYHVLSWLVTLIKKGTSEVRSAVVFNLYFLFEKSKDIETLLRLLNLTVRLERRLTHSMIHSLAFIMHWIKRWATKKSKSTGDLQTALLPLLQEVPHIDWDVEELLDFSCNNIDCVIDFIDYRFNQSMRLERKEFEAIPFNGIKSIGDKIHSYHDFKKLMERIIFWYKKDSLFRFYLKCLMKSLKPLAHTYMGKYIEEQLRIENTEHALIASRFLEFTDNTYSIFLKILQKAFDSDFREKAKDIFDLVGYSDGWSAKSGEPLPALVSKKGILQKMYKEAKSGPVRSFIKECILSIERKIDDHMKEDEEFLIPRG